MPNKSRHSDGIILLRDAMCLVLKRRAGLRPCDSYHLRGIRGRMHTCARYSRRSDTCGALWNPVFHARIRPAITGTGNFRGAHAPRFDEKFIVARRMYVVVCTYNVSTNRIYIVQK